MRILQQKTRGFTLVEMLVYIAVLILLAAASIQGILAMGDLIAKYKAEQLVLRSATTAVERILYDIRQSEAVTSFSSDVDGSLALTTDGSQITYATSGPALHVSVAGVDQGPLTQTGVTVNELRFYAYDQASDFARVILTLEATVGDYTVTKTFIAGATLRESYE